MLYALWILAAANLTYILYRAAIFKNNSRPSKNFADRIKFMDVPDEILDATPIMPKAVSITESVAANNWWDQKINLPRSGQTGSRRGKKIEHDQLLLSDLDSNL